MLPMIESETVKKHGWVTQEDIMNMLIIAESTPGVVAVNSATFIGFKVCGFIGSLTATVAVVLPSLIILSVLSLFLDAFLANEIVACAFLGIRACVAVLIFNASLKLFRKCPKTVFTISVMAATLFVRLVFSEVSTVILIFAGFALGIAYCLAENAVKGKRDA